MLDQLRIKSEFRHEGSAHSRRLAFDALSLDARRFNKRRVVLLLRDPRDCGVSGYFHLTKHLGQTYDGDIAAFIRDPLHGVEKLIRFNLAWLDQDPQTLGFLPITYEHLRADTTGVLKHVAAFAGVAIPESEIVNAVDDNSFDKMQRQDRTRLTSSGIDDPDRAKVRSGKIGGYINYLSEDDVRYCNELLHRYQYFETVEAALGRIGAVSRPPTHFAFSFEP